MFKLNDLIFVIYRHRVIPNVLSFGNLESTLVLALNFSVKLIQLEAGRALSTQQGCPFCLLFLRKVILLIKIL